MPGAIRIGDSYIVTVPEHMGHDPPHPSNISGEADAIYCPGSTNVFINGKRAVTMGMTTHEICDCGDDTIDIPRMQNGLLTGGSPNVFVNGKAKIRETDNILCHEGSTRQWSGTCSPNVIVNG